MLVVCVIIVILMGLSVTFAFQAKMNMRIKQARLSAARMVQAIETYRMLRGLLPYQSDADMNKADGVYENFGVVNQLQGIPEREPFFKTKDSEINPAGSYKDPWGMPYRVVMWKEKITDSLNRYFQVYSSGPNKIWEGGKFGPYTEAGKSKVGDDIAPAQ
jgi:type II secretory pathway pseudopilin PulG